MVFQTSGQPVNTDQAAPKPETKPEITKQVPRPVKISKPEPKFQITPSHASAKPLASPAVRKAALDQEIDLSQVTPSGKAGQITHEDLQAFKTNGPNISASHYGKKIGTTEIKVVGMRRYYL